MGGDVSLVALGKGEVKLHFSLVQGKDVLFILGRQFMAVFLLFLRHIHDLSLYCTGGVLRHLEQYGQAANCLLLLGRHGHGTRRVRARIYARAWLDVRRIFFRLFAHA